MRRRRIALVTLLLVVSILPVPVVLTWRALRQEGLNRGLILAVRDRDVSLVARLLNAGADPNARPFISPPQSFWQILRNRWRSTPERTEQSECALQVAVSRAHVVGVHDRENTEALVRTLLDGRADPNELDAHGASPLVNAMSYTTNTPAVALMLINRGANIDGNRNDEGPPLVMAANDNYDRNREIINVLLDRGVNINTKDKNGYTALRQAAECGCVPTVKLLLHRGADVNARDCRGDTILASISRPVDEAVTMRPRPAILTLLKQAGAMR